MWEDNRSEKRQKKSTWPKGSWALRREVEALWTEEGEVVGGAGGCWEEERNRQRRKYSWKMFDVHACRAGAREAEILKRRRPWSCKFSLPHKSTFSSHYILSWQCWCYSLTVLLKTTICYKKYIHLFVVCKQDRYGICQFMHWCKGLETVLFPGWQ